MRFEIAHLEINEWFLPIADLLFVNICNPFVEIDFKRLFQRLLDNDIYLLQFIGTIGKNKRDKYIWVLFLDQITYSCVHSNNQSTIQTFDLLVSQIVGFACASRPTKHYKQNPSLSPAWTNDFH